MYKPVFKKGNAFSVFLSSSSLEDVIEQEDER